MSFERTRQHVLDLLAAGPEVDFFENGHRYVVGGQEVPSVSRLAGGADGYSAAEKARPDVLTRGRMVADAVHFLETTGRGRMVPDDLRGFLKSWQLFKRRYGWRTIASEHVVTGWLAVCPLCSQLACGHTEDRHTLVFAGRFDVLGVFDDELGPPFFPPGYLWIPELKTNLRHRDADGEPDGPGALPASACAQAYGYQWAVAQRLGRRYRLGAFALRLDGDGEMRFERKRTKADEKRVPVFWNGRPEGLARYAESPTVPLLSDLRPVFRTDLETFHLNAWRYVDESRAPVERGGDVQPTTKTDQSHPSMDAGASLFPGGAA